MAFHWRVLYQLYDDESDRFWYATYEVERDRPVTFQTVIRDVRAQVSAQLAGFNYEELVEYLDSHYSRPSYTLEAAWQD